MKLVIGSALLGLTCILSQNALAQGSPVTISNPFFNLENDGPNSLGFTTGEFFRVGATTVIPNGAASPPTSGVGTTINTVTGATFSTNLNFDPGPNIPDFYSRYFSIGANSSHYFGPWTLTFTNGSFSSSAVVTLPAGQQMAPFIQTATVTGTAQNPTFSWTPPAGAVVDGYRINIYQNNLVSAQNDGQIYSLGLGPQTTSFTVPTVLSSNGFTTSLTAGTQYSLSVDILQTKDGSTTNFSNGDLAAISRTYFDFTPQATQESVYLPQVSNGVFLYDIPVTPGQVYTVDPTYATGYRYAEGAGGPNFASVELPAVQSNAFTLTFSSGGHSFIEMLNPGTTFFFPGGGVSAFTVTGIDVADHIVVGNTTAFDTNLTFTGKGVFSGSQTPLSSAVPEPGEYAMMIAGLLAMGFVLRRRGASIKGSALAA